MFFELSEKEFLKLLNYRLRKASELGDMNMYNAHMNLLKYYEKAKKAGMIIKFYLAEDRGLYVFPYYKKEYEILTKKYREVGIW